MLSKARVCVLVSGGGTNLQAIIDACKSGVIKSAEVSVVVASNPSAYALERAKNNGIPAEVVHKKMMPSQQEFEQAIIDIIERYQIDFIVLAGFMCILSENFTSRYPEKIINVHPSLIPSFCGKGFYGLRVHEAALSYGVKVTGATVHFVNEIPDGGRIIMQKAVAIEEGDTPEVLQKRVMEQAEWIILPQSVEKVAKEIINRR
ncbi:MAG: phosphoribosylglycinamide formyltransferase [Clostridia bacterium]|nr:phosphoribosylglycinamide formyltransferase [Clostridia bacterium]